MRAALVAFHLALAAVWIRVDRTPPYWDEAWFLYQGAVQHDALRRGDLAGWYAAWTGLDRTRPPLVSALAIPFFALFGVSDDAGLLVNLVAVALLLAATSALATAIHGARAGLLAMAVVGGYPLLVGLAHILLADLFAVSLVAVALLALWRSEGFSRAGWSGAAGIALGLGALTRVTFPVFLAGPFLLTARAALGEPSRTRNLRLAALLAALLAGPWYAANLAPMACRTWQVAFGDEASQYGPTDPLHPGNLLAYVVRFVGTGTSAFGFLALMAGSGGLVRRPRPDRSALCFLLSSSLVGFVVFASLRNQGMKHVAGILPALAVLTGWGLVRLSERAWPLVATVVILGSGFHAVMGSLPGPWPRSGLWLAPLGEELLLIEPPSSAAERTEYAAPDPRPWPLGQILEHALSCAAPGRPRAIRIGVVPDHPGIEPYAFLFEAYRRRLPVTIARARLDNLNAQDVLIHKTGDPGWPPSRPMAEAVERALATPHSPFRAVPRSFPLPDGSEVVVLARRPPAPPFPRKAPGNRAATASRP